MLFRSLAVAGTKEYTLVASNGAGAGTMASVTVQWTGPITAPPVCTIAATSTTPTVGQNITLTATCNGSPTSYVFAGVSRAAGMRSRSSLYPGEVTSNGRSGSTPRPWMPGRICPAAEGSAAGRIGPGHHALRTGVLQLVEQRRGLIASQGQLRSLA